MVMPSGRTNEFACTGWPVKRRTIMNTTRPAMTRIWKMFMPHDARDRRPGGPPPTATHGWSPGGTAASTPWSGGFRGPVHEQVGAAEPAQDVVHDADVAGHRPVAAAPDHVVHGGADLRPVGGAGDGGLGDQAAQDGGQPLGQLGLGRVAVQAGQVPVKLADEYLRLAPLGHRRPTSRIVTATSPEVFRRTYPIPRNKGKLLCHTVAAVWTAC